MFPHGIFIQPQLFGNIAERLAFFYVEEQDGALLVRQSLKSRMQQCFIFVPFGLQSNVGGRICDVPTAFERFIFRSMSLSLCSIAAYSAANSSVTSMT